MSTSTDFKLFRFDINFDWFEINAFPRFFHFLKSISFGCYPNDIQISTKLEWTEIVKFLIKTKKCIIVIIFKFIKKNIKLKISKQSCTILYFFVIILVLITPSIYSSNYILPLIISLSSLEIAIYIFPHMITQSINDNE